MLLEMGEGADGEPFVSCCHFLLCCCCFVASKWKILSHTQHSEIAQEMPNKWHSTKRLVALRFNRLTKPFCIDIKAQQKLNLV